VRAGAEVIAEALQLDLPAAQIERQLEELLPGIGRLALVRIAPDAECIGRSFAELHLHGATGAEVLAIARGAETKSMPGVEHVLAGDDVVALGGSPDAVEAARRLLQRRSTPSTPK
jgi:CPA2 family monovalent cation:H+ antiporter-2